MSISPDFAQDFAALGNDLSAQKQDEPAPELSPDAAFAPDAEPSLEAQSPEAPTSEPKSPDADFVMVTDESGKRTKVKVDYTPEKVKKAYEMAAGMRKFQAERDRLSKEAATLKTQMAEKDQLWNKVEEAYKQGGADGLLKLLSKGQESMDTYLEKEMQRRQLKSNDPDAYARLEAKEAEDRKWQEYEAKNKEMSDKLSKIEAERDEVEKQSLMSNLSPAFTKYNFSGKLGDADAEHRLNKMLWNDTLETLAGYEEQGIAPTPQVIEREFSKASMAVAKYLNKQGEKKATASLDAKKRTAKESAQAQVLSKQSSMVADATVDQHIANGDIGGLWNKFFTSSSRK